jgi:hypothetical protein
LRPAISRRYRRQIQNLESIFSPATLRQVILNLVLISQAAWGFMVWSSSDADGGSFWHLHKNAFVFMRPLPPRRITTFSERYVLFAQGGRSALMPLATILSTTILSNHASLRTFPKTAKFLSPDPGVQLI